MNRVPNEKQYELLRVLGNGCALVVGRPRQVEPLLRRGWVTGEEHGEGRNRHYVWVRITPDGLRALAVAVERYGLPDLGPQEDAA